MTPHSWLLPRVAAAIHHGGAGTAHTVAMAGIPSIIVPFAADQFFWAKRLATLGVAPSAVAGQKIAAPQLAAMIAFCQRPEVREKAKDLGRRLSEERGIDNEWPRSNAFPAGDSGPVQ